MDTLSKHASTVGSSATCPYEMVKNCECGPFQRIGMGAKWLISYFIHACKHTVIMKGKAIVRQEQCLLLQIGTLDDAVTNLTQHRAHCPPTVSYLKGFHRAKMSGLVTVNSCCAGKSQWATVTVTSQFNESQQWLLWMIVYTPWMKIISIKCIKSRWVFKHFPLK